jgi:hypothetical protein
MISDMQESSFFQYAGRVMALRQAHRMLRIFADERFGEPDAIILKRLELIDDIEHLVVLARRVYHVSDWYSLLAESETVAL